MKRLPFRWEAGSLHVQALLLLLLTVTFHHSLWHISIHSIHPGGKKESVYGLTYFRHSSCGAGELFREPKRHRRRHTSAGLSLLLRGEQGAAAFNQWRTTQISSTGYWGSGSNVIMDILALEAKTGTGTEPEKKSTPRPKPKPPKKAKRTVYFEVEILDKKTKEKLLLLDKVSVSVVRESLITLTFYIDHNDFLEDSQYSVNIDLVQRSQKPFILWHFTMSYYILSPPSFRTLRVC